MDGGGAEANERDRGMIGPQTSSLSSIGNAREGTNERLASSGTCRVAFW